MTDPLLRCNNLQCRHLLTTRAIVTTCSHVFCVDCGSAAFAQTMVCPACETSLTQRDDIVVSELNPTEDYKSSVISGLRPDLIIEIAGRALSFWVYQVSQESVYQAMLFKDLDEQCSKLERQMQSLVREANQEIAALQENLAQTVKANEMEKHRHHDLAEQLAEKTRQFLKLQTIYDKLKRKTMIAQRKEIQTHVTTPESSPSASFIYSQRQPLFGCNGLRNGNTVSSALGLQGIGTHLNDRSGAAKPDSQLYISGNNLPHELTQQNMSSHPHNNVRASTPLNLSSTDASSRFQPTTFGTKIFGKQSSGWLGATQNPALQHHRRDATR
ncbi:hypothetical protein BASA83_007465 [Batrachochytrium salamandrivorans]|nr:hypothetical protein BASA62_004416 [Batrachochytrium salamandrivorans]KAH9270465.1 hypothetical protein BASA83_007465 [Batrachochytrium salamandrivorans]